MYKLRELNRADLKTINQWRNDVELIACLGAPFRFINEEVDVAWYDQYMKSRGNAVRCAIVEANNESRVLGLISLVGIDYINRSAELHIMIGNSTDRGKGVGLFAVREILKHAFNNLNLRRVELEVLEYNMIARNLYKKAGMVEEGIKRKAAYKDGEYVNIIMMGILKEEWQLQNKN